MPSIRRQAARSAGSSRGSTTTSAPRSARPAGAAWARSRRRRSARCPAACSAAITARPTGPQPSTMAASPSAIRLLATACTPTASGSVSAASRWSSPAGTFWADGVVQHHQLGVAAGVAVGEPDAVQPVGVEGDRQRHDDVARPGCRSRGPSSTTSQQNSWPITVRSAGSNGTGAHRVGRLIGGAAPRPGRPARAPWLQQVEVAAADAAGQHPGQHLARARAPGRRPRRRRAASLA